MTPALVVCPALHPKSRLLPASSPPSLALRWCYWIPDQHILIFFFFFSCSSVCVPTTISAPPQAFKRPDADLAAKKLAQSLLSKILGSFVAKLTALAQVGNICG